MLNNIIRNIPPTHIHTTSVGRCCTICMLPCYATGAGLLTQETAKLKQEITIYLEQESNENQNPVFNCHG